MDTPTRRFDSGEAGPERSPRWITDEGVANLPRRCLRCDYPLTAGMLHTVSSPGKLIAAPIPAQSLIVSIWAGKNWLGAPKWDQAPCDVLICTHCGYTELAIDPAQLTGNET